MNTIKLTAIAAASLWIASELVELSVGMGTASLILTTLAFGLFVPGMRAVADPGGAPSRAWRAAIAVAALGFLLMSLVSARMLWSGSAAHPEDALFFSAVGCFSLGLLAVGGLAIAQRRHPRSLAVAFTLLGALSIVANGAELGTLANLANLGFALVFLLMAARGSRSAAALAV